MSNSSFSPADAVAKTIEQYLAVLNYFSERKTKTKQVWEINIRSSALYDRSKEHRKMNKSHQVCTQPQLLERGHEIPCIVMERGIV